MPTAPTAPGPALPTHLPWYRWVLESLRAAVFMAPRTGAAAPTPAPLFSAMVVSWGLVVLGEWWAAVAVGPVEFNAQAWLGQHWLSLALLGAAWWAMWPVQKQAPGPAGALAGGVPAWLLLSSLAVLPWVIPLLLIPASDEASAGMPAWQDRLAWTLPELRAMYPEDRLENFSPSTPRTTHIATGEHLALSSTGHTSLSIGKRLLASDSALVLSPGLDGAPVLDKFPGMRVLGYFTRPESRGWTHVTSKDPAASPAINANHFAEEIDRRTAVDLFKWLRRLGRQPTLSQWITEETGKGAAFQTDEEIAANLLLLGGTSFHIAGTAAMGADETSVLDPQLRVRGVDGLRVCDTSIMPTLVSGNTNAPAMAIAMNAADIILSAKANS